MINDHQFLVIVNPVLGVTYKFTGNLEMEITDQRKTKNQTKPGTNHIYLKIFKVLKDSHLTT